MQAIFLGGPSDMVLSQVPNAFPNFKVAVARYPNATTWTPEQALYPSSGAEMESVVYAFWKTYRIGGWDLAVYVYEDGDADTPGHVARFETFLKAMEANAGKTIQRLEEHLDYSRLRIEALTARPEGEWTNEVCDG